MINNQDYGWFATLPITREDHLHSLLDQYRTHWKEVDVLKTLNKDSKAWIILYRYSKGE